MRYGLDDRPQWGALILYGLQWWAVTLPCVLILGAVVASLGDASALDRIYYLQKLFIMMGVGLALQILVGHKMPLVFGPAAVLLIGILSAFNTGTAAINTSIIIGGLLLLALSASGLINKLLVLFTPRIIVVILALIAFTLLPSIVKLSFDNEGVELSPLVNLLFVLGLNLFLLILGRFLSGIGKSLLILLGLIVGALFYPFLVKVFATGNLDAYYAFDVLLEPLNNYNYGHFFSNFVSFNFDFNLPVVIAFLFCFLALLVNDLGSIQAVGQILNAPNLPQKIKSGMCVTGTMNAVSGLMGIIGPVNFSLSPGVIFATGCASRFTLLPAAFLLVVAGCIPHLVIVLGSIAAPVMGALMLYLMGSQLAAALELVVRKQAVTTFNQGIIIGLPLMVALLIAFAPIQAILALPDFLRPILGNGFVMGTITVMLLEHCLIKD